MLEDASVKGELPNLQKQTIQRSVETMTIAEWKMRESSDQMFTKSANYLYQRKKETSSLGRIVGRRIQAE